MGPTINIPQNQTVAMTRASEMHQQINRDVFEVSGRIKQTAITNNCNRINTMVSSTTGDIKKSAAPLVTPFAMSHRFEAKNPAIDRTSLVLVLFMTFTPRHIHIQSQVKIRRPRNCPFCKYRFLLPLLLHPVRPGQNRLRRCSRKRLQDRHPL